MSLAIRNSRLPGSCNGVERPTHVFILADLPVKWSKSSLCTFEHSLANARDLCQQNRHSGCVHSYIFLFSFCFLALTFDIIQSFQCHLFHEFCFKLHTEQYITWYYSKTPRFSQFWPVLMLHTHTHLAQVLDLGPTSCHQVTSISHGVVCTLPPSRWCPCGHPHYRGNRQHSEVLNTSRAHQFSPMSIFSIHLFSNRWGYFGKWRLTGGWGRMI